ncbi:hypothetical protein GO003_023045 [Methylicorpusculum oleiharenae]|uniref:hypothetical protein n=1 Tax=Methylicorpusculum oleiharenae TaxID=1338687 RepID=UPI00135B670F|nr:hypothetical protein [Methylicorpusculum oleiharenae]MBS3952033.1 hypothetical protein [Methylomicrobium sp.]MCD2453262.1 hypothetical protein [Methylicorpusculum oleiharenae]
MEILLIGAVIMIFAVLASAWLMTFAKWFPIQGIDGVFLKDYKTLIRAHVDFVLMSLFCLAFYAIKIPLPALACWCVVIGGMTNPGVFVIAAFDTNFWDKPVWKVYTALSFAITTIGFVWVGATILAYAI